MSIVFTDWVGESTPTLGTGDLTLGGSLQGFAPMRSSSPGTIYYTIVDGLDKETGIGTFDGAATLQRTTIVATLINGVFTPSGSPLDLSGNAQVFGTINSAAMKAIHDELIILGGLTPEDIGAYPIIGGDLLGPAIFKNSPTGIHIDGGDISTGTNGDFRYNPSLKIYEVYVDGWQPVDASYLENALKGFNGLLTPPPSWADVPKHSDPDIGDELDAQAQALAARTEYLRRLSVNVKDPAFAGGATGSGTVNESPAFQAAVDSPSKNGQSITVPSGDYSFDSAIASGAKGLWYEGTGPNATRLLTNKNISIIEHGLGAGQPLYTTPLTLRGVCLFTSSAGSNKPAITAKFNRSSGGFLLEDVNFGSFNANYGFLSFVKVTGGSRTTFRTVRANGSVFGTDAQRAAGPQVGFHFISNDNTDKSYEYVFDDIFVSAEKNGFLFECLGPAGNSGSLEGITMTNVRGRSNIGPWIEYVTPNDGSAWKPPLFTMGAGCNYQGAGAIAHFDGIEAFIMSGNWHAQDAALTGTPSLDLVRLANARKVIIENNTFRIYDAAKLQWVISVVSGCSDVVIKNNTFIYEGAPAVAGGGIFVDVSVTNLVCRDNVFVNWPAGLPKARYSNGQDIPLGDEVTISGSFGGTTNASGKMTVNFPLRPNGTAYFTVPPLISGVCNGDFNNGGNNFFSFTAATVTATGFEVTVRDTANAPVANAPRRVNWTATGK